MNFFYPEDLPITQCRDEIVKTILANQVTIISGDTGSGKTTQLPKMCYQACNDPDILIGCTQPRRIAASSVAQRVSEETRMPDIVGYKIRFHDHTNENTRIKFMTDGVLLAETRQDRLLSKYGVLIIDEAHERNLNIDFLLGYLKQLIKQRNDLKIIITSATIDTQSFSKHFNNAPIISVSGRAYPVTVSYHPAPSVDETENILEHCVNTTVDLYKNNPQGDILVFLPTEKDIRECCRLLASKIPAAQTLPLFGRLPVHDQQKIFQSSSTTKIVVATNVAETSITVPGIRYVIDSGLARISHYNIRAKTTGLPIAKISKASCNQRKGRCGRIGPGLCLRLYSEEDFENRDEYTLPEIKRSNLAEVILQMITLDFGEPSKFPFIDPPYKNAIREGYRLLRELGAVDEKLKLTRRGKTMAGLPIDPCISRILIEANNNNCLTEVKIIASVLAIQDPRIRPAEQENRADEAHRAFRHPHSDFMVLLNIWKAYHEQDKSEKSWTKLKKFCKKNYLSFQRMREWFDLHNQLDRILSKNKGFNNNPEDAKYDLIHKSIMSGFLRNLAVKKQGKLYQGSYNKELMIFPGSPQFSNKNQWIMASEFIETNRLYALTVAAVEPEWAEAVGSHLCKYSWSDPHYEKKRGQISATEKVSLFGLIIVAGRRVTYGKQSEKCQKEARDIFIQQALVKGELLGTYDFLKHNLELVQKWQQAENKLRVRNIIADDHLIYEFYAKTLPTHVYDRPSLNRYLKKTKARQKLLFMTEDDILLRRPNDRELVDYPPNCNIGQISIDLEYSFSPGSGKDGVTFRLPLDLAPSLDPEVFNWLVPGFLQEKITFLLKGLPKQIRKKLVPVSETVNILLDSLEFRSGSLLNVLERNIFKQFRLLIQRSEWPTSLPPHLQPRFSLINEEEVEVAAGRNLPELLQTSSGLINTDQPPELTDENQRIRSRWENTEHNSWNFENIPRLIPVHNKAGAVSGFLHLCLVPIPEKSCVMLKFTQNQAEAEQNTYEGNLYLLWLQFTPQHKSLKKYLKTALSGPSAVVLSKLGISRQLIINNMLDYALRSLVEFNETKLIEKEQFERCVESLGELNLFSTIQTICDNILALYRKRKSTEKIVQDIFSKQSGGKFFLPQKKLYFCQLLDEIFPVDLFLKVHSDSIQDIDRQLESFRIRLERFAANPLKDENKNAILTPYLQKLSTLEAQYEDLPADAKEMFNRYKTMVSEYRISVFSPEIKTKFSVSPKKLEQQWRQTLAKC